VSGPSHAAEAHLNAIYDLLGLQRGVVHSHQVLARAAIEHMVRSSWLSEPSMGVRERLARWETERLYSAAEAAKLGFEENYDEIKRKVLTTAEALGIPKLKRSKGRPPELVRRPSSTDLVRLFMLDQDDNGFGGSSYRIYSATTRGTRYALVQNVNDQPTRSCTAGWTKPGADRPLRPSGSCLPAWDRTTSRRVALSPEPTPRRRPEARADSGPSRRTGAGKSP